MSEQEPPYATTPIEPDDTKSGFSCGTRALDDYFARHAVANDRAGVGRAYVLRRMDTDATDLPTILGFYTLSMANAESAQIAPALQQKLPKYPMPVALIGRLAIDARAQGQRFGELLLLDAVRRVVDASTIVGCIGIVVDAKHASAEQFYAKYDFVTVSAETWPHRMFLPIATARTACTGA
jgi:predicted GNAT family N-acyltransferase